MVQAHLGEPAPTDAALEQVREQIDGATGALGANADIVVRQGMPNTKLPSLHLVPELVIDDAQVRYVLRDPLVRRVRPSLSLAGYMTKGFAQFQMDKDGKLNRLRLSSGDGQAYELRRE